MYKDKKKSTKWISKN